MLGVIALSACAGVESRAEHHPAPQSFYTVTGEIALARQEPRVAALQYAAAAATQIDPALLERATQVTAETLQPTLMAAVAARWLHVEPNSLPAQRAAGRAALALHRVAEAAAHYRVVLSSSPQGTEAEFAQLGAELAADENVFGARQLADRLAAYFPASPAALRMQGLTALRADDPAAAVHSLRGALAIDVPDASETRQNEHKQLAQTLLRARIMAGDVAEPLAHAEAQLKLNGGDANRFDYAVLLVTAQRIPQAEEQLQLMVRDPGSTAMALRLMGMLEFQQGHDDAATAKFRQLLTTGKFSDDAFYYLGLIADRNGDAERALRFYAQVQGGDEVISALLRAAALLQTHGAAAAAEELLDRLGEDEPQRLPEILTARARMYAQSDEPAKAFAVLERGIAQFPDSVELRYAAASVYEDHGQVAAALRELQQLVKQRPQDPAALNALGFTLADHEQNLQRARNLIERAYAAAPKNAAILDSLGWVLFRQGHPEQALPYLTAAYADDRGGDIAAHLGEVQWSMGRHDEALKTWFEASMVDSDNRLLKSTRQRLNPAH